MATENEEQVSYSQFACIGAGFSAIALGATLKRWYNITDVRFFERHKQLGGTWWANKYPGAACDVPSALYSFSFETSPNWTRVLPSSDELCTYLTTVASKYDLPQKMTFEVDVEHCEWLEERGRWRLRIRHNESARVSYHEAQFLFAATGQLVRPRDIELPGVESFKGAIFHSSSWRHDVDLTDKKVVIFGNGCTASQIVPSIVKKTGHLTQIVRSKHWFVPPVDRKTASVVRFILRYIPGAMTLQRFLVYAVAENELRAFFTSNAGNKFRQSRKEKFEKYMRATTPERYHDMVIPEFEVGCKRRIFDAGYLASLHSDNLTLTNEKPLEIVPDGVRTDTGIIKADVIILANGFVTNNFVDGMQVIGRGGETVSKHWEQYGGPGAYNCSVLSGFPNFFYLLGPNSATGHTSTVMAIENSVNYALRVIKPVLDGKASVVDLKQGAESNYVSRVQGALENTVWSTGCNSWYVRAADNSGKQWNGATYPWTQGHFWYRSLFPTWSDWQYRGVMTQEAQSSWSSKSILAFFVVCATASLMSEKKSAAAQAAFSRYWKKLV